MFKKVLIGVIAIGLVGFIFGWKYISLFLAGVHKSGNTTTVEVPIAQTSDFKSIMEILSKKGIVDDTEAFERLAVYKKLDANTIEFGMHRIEAHTTYRQLINGLLSGSSEVEVKVTFNNCNTISDLCEKVSKCLGINASELENYIYSENTLNKFGFAKETIPALFLPNTYKMFYDTDKERFVQRMADEFKKFWTPERMNLLKEQGLKTPSEAVTLASVVYGEQSKRGEEWPIIAGLYLNRIRTGMRLQSDPTFKFCWEDQLKGVQRLTYEHRSKDCPYNTYLHDGLPPGPISLPPTAVVEAVLHADKNNYIYMCAQANYDGLHDFTPDYATHEKNAKAFQNWLANELKN